MGNYNRQNEFSDDDEVELPMDMGDVDGGQEFPDLVAGGPYLFEIEEIGLRGKKDEPEVKHIRLQLMVVDAKQDAHAQSVGRKHWDILPLAKPGQSADDAKKTMMKTASFFKAVTRDDDEPIGRKINNEVLGRFIGRRFIGTLENHQWNGNTSLRLKWDFHHVDKKKWDGLNFYTDDDGMLAHHEAAPVAPKAPVRNGTKGKAKPASDVDVDVDI